MERLADLDECIIRCRTPEAKKYVAEAVSCYRAGAYRSSIVATWVATVYDLLDKVRDLELHGDAKAKAFLKEFAAIQDAHRRGDPDALRRSLEFERTILDRVRDEFEMLTPSEHLDLSRLREDRNRCAHPTVNQPDETYNPPAELARLHLRNAIFHVLQHPPAQGKAALDVLKRDLASTYFPTDVERAMRHFRGGPLARARDALVREFLRWLVSSFFDPAMFTTQRRIATAIGAVRKMYPSVAEEYLPRFFRAETGKLSDNYLWLPLGFAALVDDSWRMLLDADHQKLRTYVENVDFAASPFVVPLAESIPDFVDLVASRVRMMDEDALAAIARYTRSSAAAKRCVELLQQSRSWSYSNRVIQSVMLPLLHTFTENEVAGLLQTAADNGEVRHAFEFKTALAAIRTNAVVPPARLNELLVEAGLEEFVVEAEATAA